jgi:hypothetical protein
MDILNMDIDSLYKLYHSNPLYRESIEDAICEKPEILLKFVLEEVYNIPTITSLKYFMELTENFDDSEVFDELIERIKSTYSGVWFPSYGMTGKLDEVLQIIEIDHKVENEIIWEAINLPTEQFEQYVGGLVNPH